MTATEGASAVTNLEIRANLQKTIDEMAMPASAIARAMAYAIEQPDGVDVGEIVVRPTAQA